MIIKQIHQTINQSGMHYKLFWNNKIVSIILLYYNIQLRFYDCEIVSLKNEKLCCDFIILFTYILLCSILVHLSRNKAEVSMFAPDMEQMHAIDHTKGEPMSVNRSVLQTIGCYWLHKIFMDRFYLGLLCLRPLSAIFQLYRGG